MAWSNLVKPLSTADVSGNVVSQRFRHPTKQMVVTMVAIGFEVYNDPAFTDMKVRIYSDRGGSPGKMLAESTTAWTKAQIHTDDYALKFASFLFAGIELQAGEWYHIVMVPSAYTGVDGSWLGWRYSYPDPQYPTGITLDGANANRHHLEFSLFGYTLEQSE